MSTRDAYIEKAQAKIDEYSAKLDQLKAQAKSKQADEKLKPSAMQISWRLSFKSPSKELMSGLIQRKMTPRTFPAVSKHWGMILSIHFGSFLTSSVSGLNAVSDKKI